MTIQTYNSYGSDNSGNIEWHGELWALHQKNHILSLHRSLSVVTRPQRWWGDNESCTSLAFGVREGRGAARWSETYERTSVRTCWIWNDLTSDQIGVMVRRMKTKEAVFQQFLLPFCEVRQLRRLAQLPRCVFRNWKLKTQKLWTLNYGTVFQFLVLHASTDNAAQLSSQLRASCCCELDHITHWIITMWWSSGSLLPYVK